MATLGRTDVVLRFVEALQAQTCRDFELIVVDQNPDDRLAPVLDTARALGIALRHVRQAEPNLSRARNAGLALAACQVVAFPDDDCWYEPDTVRRVIKRFQAPDRPQAVVIRWIEQDPRGRAEHAIDVKRWRSFREVPASSIAQFHRTESCRALGGFDLALGLHSWFGAAEETDLMFRALAGGGRVVYLPDAIVHHPLAAAAVAPAGPGFRRARSRARGTGGLYAKHRLPLAVVLRGFCAPAARALLHLGRPGRAAADLGTALGRVEGYLRWKGQS
jgi:glycosyltransferase involved in cell wall biosynthesis